MEGTLEALESLDTRKFLIAVKGLANDLMTGMDRSPFVGSGTEYSQSRPYVPGDPLRSMDWRVTARLRRPFVKEYEAPKQYPCILLVDTSASMTVTSQEHSKYALAVAVAGGLALACLDKASPVGVLGIGGRDLRVNPSLSRQKIMQWLTALRSYRCDEPTRLVASLSRLAPRLLRRTLLMVLSDFHEPGAFQQLKRLAQVHDVVAIRFQDPAEIPVPGSGFLPALEAETGRSFLARGKGQWVDEEAMTGHLRSSGIDQFVINTGQPFVTRLRGFLKNRERMGRGAR